MSEGPQGIVRSRGWCWTLNNPTRALELVAEELAGVRYLVYGRELSSSGTPHLQGFVYFVHPVTFSTAKRRLPEGSHVEAMRGTPKQASDYAKKDGDFFETGSLPVDQAARGEGEKKRWKEARAAAEEGRMDDIPDDIYIRYLGNLHRIREQKRPRPAAIPVLVNEWLWGATGTGKSVAARVENPLHYLKGNHKWWTGYQGEPCVILEEWSPHLSMLASYLKKWADHHPFAAETKGGETSLRPEKIVVTSNFPIETCFPEVDDQEPLLRRFRVRHFPEDGNSSNI